MENPDTHRLGIDVLVRKPDGRFHVWQSKRYKSISKSTVNEAVRFFLNHKWASRLRVSCSPLRANSNLRELWQAIEEARTALRAKNIEFEALDASKLTERLRTNRNWSMISFSALG